jgi:antitoxin component YwqK of YwqJK toxin-antitoxin module
MVGLWRYYYDTGQLKKSGIYQFGEKHGLWEAFSKEGERLDARVFKGGEVYAGKRTSSG